TSTDTDARQGICIALRELIASASPESLEDFEKTLISVVRTALVDSDEDVREAAAEAFDSLQKVIGKRSIDQVLPHLLALLRSEDDADNALAGLLTLLTEASRSNVILPNLLPTLLTSPISAFNARALASLAQVASSAMTRRLPNILNALMDNIVACKDDALRRELDVAFDTILVSVDEYDGLNTMMSAMRALVKHDDHRKRASADTHLAKFFQTAQVDFSRYYPDLIRVLLIAFDDSDKEVVKAAWSALSALTQRLRKEEMESLVVSTRQTLNQVGVAGHDLPGFSLPKGINAVLPIFLQGLMNGSAEQRTQAALAISDLIDRTSADGLKPFVTQITGPLIRVVSERSTELKAAILLTLNNLLEKIPTFLKPFLPQLQRTFAKSLADPSSEVLRSRAAKALGTLITMTPRIDPLIAELVTGAKTTDAGVKNAMLKALYEVVSKAGSNMSEVSRNSILGLIDSDSGVSDAALDITFAKLLGALIKVLPQDAATSPRILVSTTTPSHELNYPDYQYQPRKPSEKKRRMTKTKLAELAKAQAEANGYVTEQQSLPDDFDPATLLDQSLGAHTASHSMQLANFGPDHTAAQPLIHDSVHDGLSQFQTGAGLEDRLLASLQEFNEHAPAQNAPTAATFAGNNNACALWNFAGMVQPAFTTAQVNAQVNAQVAASKRGGAVVAMPTVNGHLLKEIKGIPYLISPRTTAFVQQPWHHQPRPYDNDPDTFTSAPRRPPGQQTIPPNIIEVLRQDALEEMFNIA
ncbi:translational activator of GCN4, partial [Friedmanniomyces endolithicus]